MSYNKRDMGCLDIMAFIIIDLFCKSSQCCALSIIGFLCDNSLIYDCVIDVLFYIYMDITLSGN